MTFYVMAKTSLKKEKRKNQNLEIASKIKITVPSTNSPNKVRSAIIFNQIFFSIWTAKYGVLKNTLSKVVRYRKLNETKFFVTFER